MRSYIDCVHCYFKQAVSCMTMAGIDEEIQYGILYRLMDFVKDFDRADSPAENSTKVIFRTYDLIKCNDPYRDAKKISNDLALGLYPELRRIVETSDDRLLAALKVSVAGNIIDLGINRSFDIDEGLRHSMGTGFSIDHYEKFLERLGETKDILFLGDNAGEIVFDGILVEELVNIGRKVIYVVKDGPVLNDSTMEDAVYTGMDRIARVMANGSSYLGTCLNRVSQEFMELLRQSRLVISKGQANFETLENEKLAQDRVFFLLKIKCDEVAKVAGAKLGDAVFFSRPGCIDSKPAMV